MGGYLEQFLHIAINSDVFTVETKAKKKRVHHLKFEVLKFHRRRATL
jgi:hypothetical protein